LLVGGGELVEAKARSDVAIVKLQPATYDP